MDKEQVEAYLEGEQDKISGGTVSNDESVESLEELQQVFESISDDVFDGTKEMIDDPEAYAKQVGRILSALNNTAGFGASNNEFFRDVESLLYDWEDELYELRQKHGISP